MFINALRKSQLRTNVEALTHRLTVFKRLTGISV
jgi:hypothetical protein